MKQATYERIARSAKRGVGTRLTAAECATLSRETRCQKCYGMGEILPAGPSDAPVTICEACGGTGVMPAELAGKGARTRLQIRDERLPEQPE